MGGFGIPGDAQPEPPAGAKGRKKNKNKEDGNVTKKVVDRQKRFALLFALLAVIVGGLVYYGSTAPGQFVVVAKTDVPAGAEVGVNQLEAVTIPEANLVKDAIVADTEQEALDKAVDEFTGLSAQYPLKKGAQVTPDAFNVEISLGEPLAPQERLVSIDAPIANSVAAQIKAGDRVDVVASTGEVAGVIAANVSVVSVTISESQYESIASSQTGDTKDSNPDELLPGTPVPGIYVIRTDADTAEKLLVSSMNADLGLIYRPSSGEATSGAGNAYTALGIICENNPSLAECGNL